MDHAHQDRQTAIGLLKTARGQVHAAHRMVEADRNCCDISREVRAAISLSKKSGIIILKEEINDCVHEPVRETEGAQKAGTIRIMIDNYLDTPRWGERSNKRGFVAIAGAMKWRTR